MRPLATETMLLLAGLCAGPAGASDAPSAYTMPNGLRVRLAPDGRAEEVMVLLGVRAGFFEEPAGGPHLAHVAEHALAHAAAPGSAEAQAFGRWFRGGRGNAETLAPIMYFDLRVPPEDLTTALRLQAARLGSPSFAPETLAREIPNALAEVENLERSDLGLTAKFAFCAFAQAAIRGRPAVPLKATTRRFRVEDVRAFWSRTFRPDRAILSVSGKFDEAGARKAIESAFGAIPRPPTAAIEAGRPVGPGRIEATWDLSTRHLLLAWHVPPPADADHPALTLASFILMQRLHGDPELAKLARMPLVTNDTEGYLVANLWAKPGVSLQAIEDRVMGQVRRLADPQSFGDETVPLWAASVATAMGPVDVESIPLQANVSREMARGSVALQLLMRELTWGDPTAYGRRVGAVDDAAFLGALERHLDPARAIIVRLEPVR